MVRGIGRNQEEDNGLDTLRNPFKLPGRFLGVGPGSEEGTGLVRSVDDILRGLARMGGAVVSDTLGEVTRGVVPGGDSGFWQDDFESSTVDDVLKPIGESFLNTGKLASEIALSPMALWDEEHRSKLVERAGEFNDDPFNFTLEHVGNAAIVGSAVSAPARAALTAGRAPSVLPKGAQTPASAAARSLQPLGKGREVRRGSRGYTRQAAAEAREAGQRFTPEQITSAMGDVVGHPYMTATRKASGSNFAQGVRSGLSTKAGQADQGPITGGNPDISPDPSTLWEQSNTPQTLYHGTRSATVAQQIREQGFRASREGESGPGVYMTPDAATAQRPTQRWNNDLGEYETVGEVISQDLNVGRVLDRNKPEGDRVFREAERRAIERGQSEGLEGPMAGRHAYLDEVLKEQGYDAVRHDHGGQHEVVLLDEGMASSGLNVNPLDRLASEAKILDKDNVPQGTSTDPLVNIGKSEQLGQTVGNRLKGIKEKDAFQSTFGAAKREANRAVEALHQSVNRGRGRIADVNQETGLFDNANPLGASRAQLAQNADYAESNLVQAIKSMDRRLGHEEWGNLINDLPVEKVTLRSLPGRVGEVAFGKRSMGHALGPEDIIASTSRILDEAEVRSAGDPQLRQEYLEQMVPNVDPLFLELRALNAIEESRGLPADTLTSALSDTITLGDKAGGLNLQAQRALKEGGRSLDFPQQARYQIPDEHLVNIESHLPDGSPERRIFNAAVDQHLWNQATRREPALVERGIIGPEGTRTVLEDDVLTPQDPREPTRFAEDLNLERLDPATRKPIEQTRAELESATARRDEARASVDELIEGVTRAGDTGRAPTVKQINEQRAVAAAKTQEVLELSGRLERMEQAAKVDPANAPVTAREYLTYSNQVAPIQARELRRLADDAEAGRASGTPEVYRQIADELDELPRTVEALNEIASEEFRLAYLHNIVDSGSPPSGRGGDRIDTSRPGSMKGRDMNVDRAYNRDIRARLFKSETEFQRFLSQQEADRWVHRAGLAKTGRDYLIEMGHSPAELRNMSPGQARQALDHAGLRAYEPGRLMGPTHRRPSGKALPEDGNPLDAEYTTKFVDEAIRGATQGPGKFERAFWEGLYDPLINNWKVVALPLRFGWQVNNAAGNAMLSVLAGGVGAADYPSLMRASQKAVRNWNQGITDKFFVPLSRKHMADLRLKKHNLTDDAQIREIDAILEEGGIQFDNSLMDQIAAGGLTRGSFAFLNDSAFMRDSTGRGTQNLVKQYGFEPRLPDGPNFRGTPLGQRARNIKSTGRGFVDYAYHMNETVDNFHRAMIYMDQMASGANHSQAMTQITKALADYSKLSRFEQRWVKRVYPFYPWMRHMADVVTQSVAPSNIQRTVVFTHLTNVMGEPNQWEEMLPDYAGGYVFTGINEEGVPEFWSTRGINPFLDVFDPIQQPNMQGLVRPLSPVFQMPYERMSGISTLTGKPFSSPGAYASNEIERPPVLEQLAKNVPQFGAARDVYREYMGQPLTRYGTGEPAFFGEEIGRTSGQSVQQIFGVNISPINVEEMHEREIQNEYQQEVARRQHEKQVEEEGGRTLGDLGPNIFGGR